MSYLKPAAGGNMPELQVDRDPMARWYAKEHLKADPGVRTIYYLPQNAPEREIRFIEVNEMISERADESLEPIDFGVEAGDEGEHKLVILDLTPAQWIRIGRGELLLPHGWSLREAVAFP
jgi:hypothetical protein